MIGWRSLQNLFKEQQNNTIRMPMQIRKNHVIVTSEEDSFVVWWHCQESSCTFLRRSTSSIHADLMDPDISALNIPASKAQKPAFNRNRGPHLPYLALGEEQDTPFFPGMSVPILLASSFIESSAFTLFFSCVNGWLPSLPCHYNLNLIDSRGQCGLIIHITFSS